MKERAGVPFEVLAPRGPDGLAGRKPYARRSDCFTLKQQADFLSALAQTCCVKTAARMAEVSERGLFVRRTRDAAFAAQWREALAAGYDAVEGKLLRYVLDEGVGFADTPEDKGTETGTDTGAGTGACEPAGDDADDGPVLAMRPRPGLGKVTHGVPGWVQTGMLLLNRHRATVEGTGGGRRNHRIATVEETDALLNKRLDMLARSIARTA